MLGLPGQGMHLGIDPLSLLFLCLLAPQVIATAIAGERKSVTFWIFVLGIMLALLAADAFTLIFGFGLASAAAWLLILRASPKSASRYIGIALFSAACFIPAVFLPAGNLAFALLLLGMGASAGLAPLYFWLPRGHAAPKGSMSAVQSGGMVNIALYVIIRYGFIIFGNTIEPWWGTALMLAGAASILIGGLRAMLEAELKTMLAWSTIAQMGLIAVGLGIALRARAMDDPALASLALQAALLCALAHALFKPLLFLGAGAVQQATGTMSLDWLGGLMRAMPRLGLLMLLGAAGMAALPLGPGFAPVFLLVHAVIAAAGSGGLISWIGYTALLAVLGIGIALALAAAMRMIGIGFLGRPRSLHAAAAEEADRPNLIGMALLAICCLPLALTPNLLLIAIQPVISQLVPNAPVQVLAYAPLPILGLMLLLAAAAFLALRRWGARGEREVPAWNGGFGKPPIWLPFGDPATQPSATGFAQPVQLVFAQASTSVNRSEHHLRTRFTKLHLKLIRLAGRLHGFTIAQRLALLFAILVLGLLVLGLGQNG